MPSGVVIVVGTDMAGRQYQTAIRLSSVAFVTRDGRRLIFTFLNGQPFVAPPSQLGYTIANVGCTYSTDCADESTAMKLFEDVCGGMAS